jgi:hypothetical protein
MMAASDNTELRQLISVEFSAVFWAATALKTGLQNRLLCDSVFQVEHKGDRLAVGESSKT